MNFPRPNSFYWLNQNATLLIIFLLQTRMYTNSSNFLCLILSLMYFFIHLLYLLCILMYLWNICNLYLLIKSYVFNILIWISRIKFLTNLRLLLFVTCFLYIVFFIEYLDEKLPVCLIVRLVPSKLLYQTDWPSWHDY